MLSMDAMYKGIDDLENTYISKRFSLNDEQLNRWYKLLKGLTDEAYLEAVDEWCFSHSTLPAPADILGIAGRMRPQDNAVVIPKNSKHCSACGNRGVVSQIEYNKFMQRDYEVIYACVCDAGSYYRDKGLFKTITKEDWQKGKKHKTFTFKETATINSMPNVTKLAEQFSMI